MNRVNTLTKDSACDIKLQRVPNIRIDNSALIKQVNNNEIRTNMKQI
jgi:hypothetical protein